MTPYLGENHTHLQRNGMAAIPKTLRLNRCKSSDVNNEKIQSKTDSLFCLEALTYLFQTLGHLGSKIYFSSPITLYSENSVK